MDFSLSTLAKNSKEPSYINRMTSEFAVDFKKGIDINIGVGYVNDNTMPVKEIAESYQHVVSNQHKYRNALNYGGAEGSPNLRQSIRDYYKRHNIGNISKSLLDKHKLVIGVNGATSILDAIADAMEPGIVVTGDPYYYSYTENLQRKGFELLPIKSDQEGLIPEALEQALENADINKISYFYIVTINNPDSIILTNDRRRRIIKIANKLSDKSGRLIPVIFDKAYEDIIHNPEITQPDSGLLYNDRGNVFEVGTFSKVLAPALRMGFMISKDNDIRRQVIQRFSDIGFSNSLINQEITSRLLDNYIDDHKKKVNKVYRTKSLIIKQNLVDILSPYTKEIRGGDAGFYFYITFKHIDTASDSHFFKFLSRTTGNPDIDGVNEKNPRLLYIPGIICSQQPEGKRQIRISYGFEEIEVFRRASQLIKEACEYVRSLG